MDPEARMDQVRRAAASLPADYRALLVVLSTSGDPAEALVGLFARLRDGVMRRESSAREPVTQLLGTEWLEQVEQDTEPAWRERLGLGDE